VALAAWLVASRIVRIADTAAAGHRSEPVAEIRLWSTSKGEGSPAQDRGNALFERLGFHTTLDAELQGVPQARVEALVVAPRSRLCAPATACPQASIPACVWRRLTR